MIWGPRGGPPQPHLAPVEIKVDDPPASPPDRVMVCGGAVDDEAHRPRASHRRQQIAPLHIPRGHLVVGVGVAVGEEVAVEEEALKLLDGGDVSRAAVEAALGPIPPLPDLLGSLAGFTRGKDKGR